MELAFYLFCFCAASSYVSVSVVHGHGGSSARLDLSSRIWQADYYYEPIRLELAWNKNSFRLMINCNTAKVFLCHSSLSCHSVVSGRVGPKEKSQTTGQPSIGATSPSYGEP